MAIFKFIVGYVLFAATFSLLPLGLQEWGLFPALRPGVWVVLVLAIASFVFKMLFYPFVSGEFNFAKYGNDLCLLSFSGLMSAFAFQQSVTFDAFPGARDINAWLPGASATQENSSGLLALLLTVLVLYIISSLAVWGAGKMQGLTAVLAIASWLLGTVAAMFFLFALSLRLAA